MRTRRSVVVVDDSSMMRGALRELLGSAQVYDVVGEACDGKEALALVRDKQPDIVLLDIEMPGMDGQTFLQHARIFTRATIVVLSASVTPGARRSRELRASGADAIVQKPRGAASASLGGGEPLLQILDHLAA